MQIKSWQIALVSTIMQIVIAFFVIIKLLPVLLTPSNDPNLEGPVYGYIISLFAIIVAIIILIICSGITLLLYNIRTRRIGAILGTILGIFYALVLILIVFLGLNDNHFGLVDFLGDFLILSPGFFLLVAGIYYFKVESKLQS